MYLVTAYFDDLPSRKLSALIERTAEISGNDFMVANKIPPHMTLLQFHSKADSESIVSVFSNPIYRCDAFDVTFANVRSEIPQVVYIPVQKNERLLEINRFLSSVFSELPETIISKHYSPENFYPHVSLAKRLDDFQRKKAEDFLKEIEIPSSDKIVRIVLTEGNPPKKLCDVILR